MAIVRVGPEEDFRVATGQPSLYGWPVCLDDETEWGQVAAVYGDTDVGKVVALGIRAEGVIHLMRWTTLAIDHDHRRIVIRPHVALAERERPLRVADRQDEPPRS